MQFGPSFGWLKRLMPRGLYGRAVLILLLPVFTMVLVVTVVFLQRHFEGVTRQMTASVAQEVGFVARSVDQAPDLAAAVKRGSDIKDVYYKMNLRLVEIETGIVEWSDEKDIRKSAKR